jgi:hypothetical protein
MIGTLFSVFNRHFDKVDVPHWSPEAMKLHSIEPIISSECHSKTWTQILQSFVYLLKFSSTIYVYCCT